MTSSTPPPPPPLTYTASVGDYDEETHQPGYTEEFVDFMLIPQSVQVCRHGNECLHVVGSD